MQPDRDKKSLEICIAQQQAINPEAHPLTSRGM
jgi:hypothetical protein